VAAVEQYTSVAGRRPLVFVSGHFPNPSRGYDFTPPFSGDPWSYSSWGRTLDVFAQGLQQLLTRGYQVLWRPFPELNNPNFWWAQAAIKDWWVRLRQEFDARGLTQLIWVYNCMSTTGGAQRYPGAAVVDMVGPTVYRGSTQWGKVMPVTPELLALGKPYCFAEIGPSDPPDGSLDCRRVLDSISYQPASWMMFWNEGWSMMRNRYGRELLGDPRVVTAAGLPW
jgi:mannan endo-1,4-beta-mannosidase